MAGLRVLSRDQLFKRLFVQHLTLSTSLASSISILNKDGRWEDRASPSGTDDVGVRRCRDKSESEALSFIGIPNVTFRTFTPDVP